MYFDLLAPVYDRIIGTREPKEIMTALKLTDLARLNSLKVIELGAGTGRFGQYFVEYTKEMWLLDPSVSMLSQAKKKDNNFKLHHGYAHNMPFPDNYFDLILIYDSLHHWRDHENSLREAFRVLKPNGKLMVGEIHPLHRNGHYIVMMEKFFRMKSKFYHPRELVSLLQNVGFRKHRVGWVRKPTYFIITRKDN